MVDIPDGLRKKLEELGVGIVAADLAQGGHIHIGGSPERRQQATAWLKEQKDQEKSDHDIKHRQVMSKAIWANRWSAIAVVIAVIALVITFLK